MKKLGLVLAITASGLLYGCASSPDKQSTPIEPEAMAVDAPSETLQKGAKEAVEPSFSASSEGRSPDESQPKSESGGSNQISGLTKLSWETWTGSDKPPHPSWVSEAFIKLSEDIGFQGAEVVLDAQGRVQNVYGQTEKGAYFQGLADEVSDFRMIEPKGFVTETTIRLKVGHRMGMEKLGLTQRLAVKRFLSDMEDHAMKDTLDQYLEEGSVELVFKGLFMNRKLAGPTEILEARGQLYGQTVDFLAD